MLGNKSNNSPLAKLKGRGVKTTHSFIFRSQRIFLPQTIQYRLVPALSLQHDKVPRGISILLSPLECRSFLLLQKLCRKLPFSLCSFSCTVLSRIDKIPFLFSVTRFVFCRCFSFHVGLLLCFLAFYVILSTGLLTEQSLVCITFTPIRKKSLTGRSLACVEGLASDAELCVAAPVPHEERRVPGEGAESDGSLSQ